MAKRIARETLRGQGIERERGEGGKRGGRNRQVNVCVREREEN
jgi:hypothetical protein